MRSKTSPILINILPMADPASIIVKLDPLDAVKTKIEIQPKRTNKKPLPKNLDLFFTVIFLCFHP